LTPSGAFLISRLQRSVYLYIRSVAVINTPQRNFETFPTFSKSQKRKISKEKNLKREKSQNLKKNQPKKFTTNLRTFLFFS